VELKFKVQKFKKILISSYQELVNSGKKYPFRPGMTVFCRDTYYFKKTMHWPFPNFQQSLPGRSIRLHFAGGNGPNQRELVFINDGGSRQKLKKQSKNWDLSDS